MNIINIKKVNKNFINAEGQTLKVLDNVNLKINEQEIVSILGKSGSGKSTLLRIIAGLIPPSKGSISYRDTPITEAVPGISMVFQSFALMPWLTVLENVELGLEARGIDRLERRKRALEAIDTIGLDGFESAYPKELSGGMRQRVGFARALVVEPDLLLMDEPFSALDILTTEGLRGDLINLWCQKKTKINAILCVTHDIEEAVLMSDRIIIFASDPGTVQTDIKIDLAHPRDTESAEFKKVVDKIYHKMTVSERYRIMKAKAMAIMSSTDEEHPEYAYRLPEVEASNLTGILEAMREYEVDGGINLPELADELHLDVNNIFTITEVLDMLRFARINNGVLEFTKEGQELANADILTRKQIFANHLLKYIPLAQHIRQILDEAPNNIAHEDVFLDQLGNYFSEDESDRILRTVIDWGRYAEIFAYDYDSGELSLENPQ